MSFNTLSFTDRNYPSASRRVKRASLDLVLGFLVAAILMFKVATADAATVSASPASVAAGTSVTSTWSAIAAPKTGDWMGLYVPGGPDNAPLATRHTTGTAAGSLPFAVPASRPAGLHEVRLFVSGTYTRLATSSPFTVTAASANLSASPASVAAGAAVTSTWSAIGTPTNSDWIGLYLPGSANNAPISFRWTTGVASGSVPFTIPAGRPAGTYELRLFASGTYTRLGTSNAFAVTAGGTAGDTVAPTVSITAPAAGFSVTGSTLAVSASASDNVGVAGVQFKLDGANLGAEVTTAPYTMSAAVGTMATGSHTLTAVARDAAGNLKTSAAVAITRPAQPTADTQAPSVPTGLAGTVLSANQIRLNWNAATDNVGVTGYYVYLNDVSLGTTTATTYTHSGLTAGTTYNYRVSAFDAVPNHSAWTAAPVAVATTAAPDTASPSIPTGLAGTALSASQIRLTWNAAADNVGVTGYHVYLNNVSIGTTASPTYTLNGLVAGTTYNYRVSAYDAVPNHSAWTAAVAVTTPGAATPPPPPTGYLSVLPGKAGYGMQTPAGRGGTVYKVTNRNASGAGSLRACTEASGPRVCVFEVSGNIDLNGGDLNIYNPYLTIAGQTAPAPGISIINGSFGIVTHDVLVQHIRARGGLAPTRRTPFSIDNTPGGTYNVVIDHVSMAWSTDDLALTWWGAHDITWSHVLATGELNNTGVYFDAAGKVMLTDSSDYNILVTDSALLTGYQRMPLAQANPFVFVNNVVYNWGGVATEYTRQRVSSGGKFVVVHNHYRTGPLHAQAWVKKPFFLRDNLVPGMQIYLEGNYAPDFAATQQWDLVDNRGPFTQPQMQAATLPAWPTGLVAKSAANGSLFETVLNNVGAFPLSRDSLDARLVSDARNRTGGYATSTTFPTLANNSRTLTLPTNPNGDDNGNGYTNLEEWLHCMAAQVEGRACQ